MFEGRACIQAHLVARDFFGLSKEQFVRKVGSGEIDLPLIRIERSAKAARLVHVNDLGRYLDTQWDNAREMIADAIRERSDPS